MKIGYRKPSIKKSIKARTTGKAKRAMKSSVNPAYGKRGSGWVNNPKKAAYNKVYNKTTISITSKKTMHKSKESNSFMQLLLAMLLLEIKFIKWIVKFLYLSIYKLFKYIKQLGGKHK